MEKSLVLIDGENLLHGWIAYCNARNIRRSLDHTLLITKLSEGTNLLRAIFYDGVPDVVPAKKRQFHDALQHRGIQLKAKMLKEKQTVCSSCGFKEMRAIQKGVDVSLATDIVRHALQRSCDLCIVVSGDEDYKDAIECAKEHGVKVWVASFNNRLSGELRKSVDRVILLEPLFDEWLRKA